MKGKLNLKIIEHKQRKSWFKGKTRRDLFSLVMVIGLLLNFSLDIYDRSVYLQTKFNDCKTYIIEKIKD